VPKIRGVKPDIWTDEDFVELSAFARLLWIGMWNYACDNGHLRDRSKQIKMRVLPTDDVNCAELVRELERNGRIIRSDGWITVPNFAEQQKPDKRYLVFCDAPGCRKNDDPERETRGGPAVGSQGPLVDGEGDGEGEMKVSKNSRASALTNPPRFDEFWDTYSHKLGRKKAEAAYRAALKKPGVTPALLIAAAAAYITHQLAEGKHPTYTKHAATWLTGEHWRDERAPRHAPQGRVGQHLALARQLAEAETPQIGPNR
jgi:hypothetical protein